jgi:hypothetical protein
MHRIIDTNTEAKQNSGITTNSFEILSQNIKFNLTKDLPTGPRTKLASMKMPSIFINKFLIWLTAAAYLKVVTEMTQIIIWHISTN